MHSFSKVLNKLCQFNKSKVGDIVNHMCNTESHHVFLFLRIGIIDKSLITIIIM